MQELLCSVLVNQTQFTSEGLGACVPEQSTQQALHLTYGLAQMRRGKEHTGGQGLQNPGQFPGCRKLAQKHRNLSYTGESPLMRGVSLGCVLVGIPLRRPLSEPFLVCMSVGVRLLITYKWGDTCTESGHWSIHFSIAYADWQ